MFFKISTISISIYLAYLLGMTNEPGFVHEVSSSKTICHGIETPYSVRIQSEEINGLVQLEFNIPKGLNMLVVNSQNSKVSYHTNSLSLLWDNLEEEEINVELVFTSNLDFEQGEIAPTLSYLKNGDRIDAELDKTTISDVSVTTYLDQSAQQDTNQTSGVSCLRQLTDEGDGVTRIDLVIDGEGFDGFLKITEETPNNCIVEIIDSELSLSQIENGILNFIWFDAKSPLPITVTYKLLGCSHKSTHNIKGKIDYAFGNSSFSHDITHYITDFQNNEVMLDLDQITGNISTEKVNNTRLNNALIPDKGVSYRVQLMAGHTDVSESWITHRYNFNRMPDTEMHEGWVKYTTGSYDDYQLARNERESINKVYPFPEPFVTAYYLGERITVGEALIISQQDWIQ
tara:strand:- start:271 stop:1473 length:1203 start_codon:yes stop_codon:yes gene_type:complete